MPEVEIIWTLSYIMLKNGQTYFKNLAVFTPQDFQSMFGHFSTLGMKGLSVRLSITETATKFSFLNPFNPLMHYFPKWSATP